jgi:hypothetical protein
MTGATAAGSVRGRDAEIQIPQAEGLLKAGAGDVT